MGQPTPDKHLAVFGRGSDVLLIDIATEEKALWATETALADDYVRCGYIDVVEGTPRVQCEPGAYAALMMVHAGFAFVDLLACSGGQTN